MAARRLFPESRVLWLICTPAMAVAILCSGCATQEKPILAGKGTAQVDTVALQYDLARFADRTLAAVAGAADTVAAATDDRSVRELTLRWKVRTADVLADLLTDPDPRSSYVRTWVMLAEDRHRFAQSDLSEKLGGQAAAVTQVLEGAEDDLVAIGRRHFGTERIAAAEAEMDTLAADPARAGEVLGRLAGTAAEAGRPAPTGPGGALVTLAGAPVAAVSSLWGVADTPTAVGHVATAVTGFTAMAKQMPERLRWEMEMLLLNAGWGDLSTELRTGVDRVGQAAESMARTAESLPADLRTESQALLSSLDESQPELQKTLAETRETVDGVTVAIEKADGLLKAADATVKEVTVAAQALESTAAAIEALIGEARGPERAGPEPEPKGEPVTVAQVTELADRMERIVGELRLLLADLKQPLPEAAAVNQAAARVEGLIDRTTWRAVAVIACALVAAVVYKLVATVISRRLPRTGRDAT